MEHHSDLRWYHFLLSWLMCLATGLIIHIIIRQFSNSNVSSNFDLARTTTIIAALLSSPFIFVFSILMHFFVLKKKRSWKQIHFIVLTMHVIGTILVFLGMLVFANRETKWLGGDLFLLMGFYFTIDSIYFHLFIHKKAGKLAAENLKVEELLDTAF